MTPELDQLLKDIEEREKAATPPPWTADQDDETYWVETPEGLITDTRTKADADFIASSRTDLPRFVKALRRAQRHFENFHSHHAETKKTVADISSILTEGENP